MNKTVANALRSTAVLTAIAVVCVGLLAVCNMFFPKYKPNLDAATAALVKKQGESFWGKVPENLFEVIGSGKVDLVEEFGSTGATVTLSAIERAVKLSAEFALEYNTAIRKAISKLSTEAGL